MFKKKGNAGQSSKLTISHKWVTSKLRKNTNGANTSESM